MSYKRNHKICDFYKNFKKGKNFCEWVKQFLDVTLKTQFIKKVGKLNLVKTNSCCSVRYTIKGMKRQATAREEVFANPDRRFVFRI